MRKNLVDEMDELQRRLAAFEPTRVRLERQRAAIDKRLAALPAKRAALLQRLARLRRHLVEEADGEHLARAVAEAMPTLGAELATEQQILAEGKRRRRRGMRTRVARKTSAE